MLAIGFVTAAFAFTAAVSVCVAMYCFLWKVQLHSVAVQLLSDIINASAVQRCYYI
jgi:hypothetical protein